MVCKYNADLTFIVAVKTISSIKFYGGQFANLKSEETLKLRKGRRLGNYVKV